MITTHMKQRSMEQFNTLTDEEELLLQGVSGVVKDQE